MAKSNSKATSSQKRVDDRTLQELVAILERTGVATSASGMVKAVRAAGISARGLRIKAAWNRVR